MKWAAIIFFIIVFGAWFYNGGAKDEITELVTQGNIKELKDKIDDSNVNHPNADGHTPLEVAVIHGHLDIVKFLLGKGAIFKKDRKESLLHYAVIMGDINVAEYLLSLGADVNWINEKNVSLLARALFNDDLKMTKLLVRHNVNINGRSFIEELQIPEFAVLRNDLEIVKTLIEKGGLDPNYTDKRGITLFMHAAARGRQEIMDYLIQKNVDPNVVSPKGLTACDYARMSKRKVWIPSCSPNPKSLHE